MTEEDVRRIVREELNLFREELNQHNFDVAVRTQARTDEHRTAILERTKSQPGDGSLVTEIKTMMRDAIEKGQCR